MHDTPVTTPAKEIGFTVNKTVFSAAAILSLLLILFTIAFPAASEAILGSSLRWVSDYFGWYYMLAVAAYLVFTLFVGCSHYGNIKLGKDQDKPDFPFPTWAAMLFSAGIGSGLMFFGASEPVIHYLTPPIGTSSTPQAAREALSQTFLHWGLHGWGIYTLIGMTLAYFAYRRDMPLSLRSALLPLFGQKRTNGLLGHTVDTLGVICTLLGLATSLGIGVLQASAGLNHVFGIHAGKTVEAMIIVAVTAAAALSAMSGVERGVRRLSEINMLGAIFLLIALLVMGPTLFLLNAFTENIGQYFQSVIGKTFMVYAYEGTAGAQWKASWTIFFWAWWTAWAPFVGLFIARISRGRTLREFVFSVLFIPLGFTFAWFSVFGNSAIDLVGNGAAELGKIALETPPMGLFALFDHYPLTTLWSTLGLVIGMIFFITSADSGALVLANLSSKHLFSDTDAPVWLRLFWAISTGLITLGLLFAGGFGSLQSVSVVAGLPFSLVLILYMVSMVICLRQEGNKRKAVQIDKALVLDSGHNWRNRLSRLVSFPSATTALRFMFKTLQPAMLEVAHELQIKGIDTKLTENKDSRQIKLEVLHVNKVDFLYEVRLVEAIKPVFAPGQSGNIAVKEKYYRAEVFLHEGSQDYDIVGYTREQIIIDILNQYERHMQFLHFER